MVLTCNPHHCPSGHSLSLNYHMQKFPWKHSLEDSKRISSSISIYLFYFLHGEFPQCLCLLLSLTLNILVFLLDFAVPWTISSYGVSYWKRIIFFRALVLVHRYPAHDLKLKNNATAAPQRLVRNEIYAVIEHQGHCGRGFLKRAKRSCMAWANKARWLMNAMNSLTNPITSDKLKCQQAPSVASHFLCCSVISRASCLQSSLGRLWGQRYSNRRHGQMLASEH